MLQGLKTYYISDRKLASTKLPLTQIFLQVGLAKLSIFRVGEAHHTLLCRLTVLLGLGPSQGIPRLWLQDFSQSFPAMLMRLVGTADTAGDWEKSRR